MRFIIHFVLRIGIIELFFMFFILANVITFLLYAIDKRIAAKGGRRVSEGVLTFFTVALGGIGALFGIFLLKHKIRKRKFKFAAVIGLVVVGIAITHIAYSFTLGRAIRFVDAVRRRFLHGKGEVFE